MRDPKTPAVRLPQAVPPPVVLLLCALAGAFSGTGEAAYYLSNLQGARQVPAGATACAAATVGRMMRQNIAVIVTGESSWPAQCHPEIRHCGRL
jgi:hypothetical protein